MGARRADQTSAIGGIPRVRLFGSLTVETEDGRLGPRDLGGSKPKQVFEILLLARGAQVSKDRLGDLLWGENGPINVAATLATYVSVLRTRLDPSPRRGKDLILTEHGSYGIRHGAVWTDIGEFDGILDTWKKPEPSSRGPLEHALTLVRGDILEDEPYASWVARDRERYRDRLAELLRRLTLCLLLEGEFPGAVTHAERALDLEPMDESACRMAMVASYGMGRQQAAFRAFDSCRRLLDRELGVEPMDETSEYAARIRRHEPIGRLVADLVGVLTPPVGVEAV